MHKFEREIVDNIIWVSIFFTVVSIIYLVYLVSGNIALCDGLELEDSFVDFFLLIYFLFIYLVL